MPAERTLQRWFLRAGLAPAPAGRRLAADSRRAERPHQIWQMDAAEQVKPRTGQCVCWLRVADECSGAALWTAVFPPRPSDSSPAVGGPSATPPGLAAGAGPSGSGWTIGVTWGSWGDLPTDLALWLIGLAVGVDWNPPARPQDHGVVERSQGTAKRWGEPQTCDSPEELQGRLEEMDVIQEAVARRSVSAMLDRS